MNYQFLKQEFDKTNGATKILINILDFCDLINDKDTGSNFTTNSPTEIKEKTVWEN